MPAIKFSKLPSHIQQRLLERQTGNEAVTIDVSRTYEWLVASVFAALWLLLLFLLSNLFRWDTTYLVIFAIVTIAAVFVLLRGILLLLRSDDPRNCFVVTRHYLLDFSDGYVDYQSIENLVTVNISHKYEAGRYARTQIDLILENGIRTMWMSDLNSAEDAVDEIGLFRKRFLEASDRGDTRYLEMNDDFRDLPETSSHAERNRFFELPYTTAVAALVVGAGIMTGAASANEYLDDVNSWKLAHEADRASSYRSYLAGHPTGRWSPDATGRLHELYDAAESKYRSSLNEGYDKDAADALSAVLRYAKETGNYRVKIIFDRHAEVPENLLEEIKSEFDVKKVLPLDDAFSSEKMLRRETDLLAVLGEAFKQIFPDDILEVSHDCSDECAKFLVFYETTFKDSIYYDLKEKDLPRAERTFKPGIRINWKFNVSLPTRNEGYEFELESVPAETIDSDGADSNLAVGQADVEKIEKNNLYDAMVNSAFADFRQQLVFRMGIGPKPKEAVETDGDSPTQDTPKLGETNYSSK